MVHPLMEIIQTVPCRAIRGKSSDSRQQYLSQQYPPLLNISSTKTAVVTYDICEKVFLRRRKPLGR